MKELLKLRLFSLLSETSPVTNEEIKNAYGCFMEQVENVSQSERNYSEIFRMLNVTRIEFAFLKSLYRYGQGEKCPEICLYRKGVNFCRF